MSKIVNVEVLENFRLNVTFEDGIVKIFDTLPFLDNMSMSRLRDEEYFRCVKVGYHSDRVIWHEGEEFGVDMMYVRGRVI